jgi:hypothetical protein
VPRIFEQRSDELTGGWRKLHIKEDETGRACSMNGKRRGEDRRKEATRKIKM